MDRVRKKQILAVLVVFVAFLLFWVWFFSIRSIIRITIKSDGGATISVARDRGATFEEIGETETVYTTRSPGDVFIRVELNESVSKTGFTVDRGDAKEIEVPLAPTVDAENYLSGGSYGHPVFDGSTIQGIDPGSSQIISFDTNASSAPRRVEFLGIPSLRSIHWSDPDNFIYTSFRSGVGLFSDGKNRGNISELSGLDISSNDLPRPPSRIFFANGAWHQNRPVVLLGDGGIYIMENISTNSLEKIVHFDTISNQAVFSDQNYIYLNEETLPAAFVSEVDDDARLEQIDEEPDVENVTNVYSYSGESLFNVTTVGSRLMDIVSSSDGEKIIALGDRNISITSSLNNSFVIDNIPTFFNVNRDLLTIDDNVYVLVDGGIWRLLPETGVLQLVSGFTGIGLSNSMTLDTNNEYLYYGSRKSPDGSGENAVYRILVSDLAE